MADRNSTAPHQFSKPAKPSLDFPLFPHWNGSVGRWAKQIRGRLVYFGPWSDPDGALAEYLEKKDALHAGRKPRESTESATVKDLANQVLNQNKAMVDAREPAPRTWAECGEACDLLVSNFGKARLLSDVAADDFPSLRTKMSKKWGPARVGKMIQIVRCVSKFAFEADLIPATARFGPGFKRPSKKTMRLHRAKQPARLFRSRKNRPPGRIRITEAGDSGTPRSPDSFCRVLPPFPFKAAV